MNKLVRENINDYLPAPSEEEIEKRLENANLSPNQLLIQSTKHDYFKGIEKGIGPRCEYQCNAWFSYTKRIQKW